MKQVRREPFSLGELLVCDEGSSVGKMSVFFLQGILSPKLECQPNLPKSKMISVFLYFLLLVQMAVLL